MRRNCRLLRALWLVLLAAAAAAGCAPVAGAAEAAAPALAAGVLTQLQRSLDAMEYQASADAAGLQAPNRRHALRSRFEPTGVRIHDRTDADSQALLDLRLVALGRPATMAEIGAGEVANDGARVEIRRPGLVEWYVNSEAGLEQGFTLAAPPAGAGPLVLELDTGAGRPRLDGERVLFETPAGRRLAFGALAALDARGARVPARFALAAPQRLQILVDDTGAAYPLVIDPLLTSVADAQLEADQANATFGVRVASAGDVNGDGWADVIVGALYYDAGQADEGAAFVFHGGPAGIASASAASAATRIEANQTIALLGSSVASAGDVNGDGYGDVIVGAHQYDSGESDEGAAFVFLGGAAGVASGDPASAAARLESNQAGSQFGRRVSSAGDVNGDGYGDVIVGAPAYGAGEAGEGAAFVFLGGAAGVAHASPATAAAQLEANQAGANLGMSVAGAGDVNGDGYGDVIVGAPELAAGESNEGAAFVFHGGAAGIASGNPASAAAQLEANQADALFGHAAAPAGDVNGDGYSDVIVGAPGYDAGETDEGAAFVFLGGASGIASGSPASAATVLASDQASAQLGWSAASAGDVNGDGYSDVIVGAPDYDAGETNEGAAFVFLGSASGVASGGPATAAMPLASDQADARFGNSVAAAGDVNGDGYGDVIVGASQFDAGEAEEGAAFVYLGTAEGVRSAGAGAAASLLESDQTHSDLGWSVASAGDVNGDGYGDVIVGAPHYDAGHVNEGAAFVFLGSSAGIASGSPTAAASLLASDQHGAGLGSSVASAGDVNGDGYGDVIVGAHQYEAQGLWYAGAAFIFLGSASGIASGGPETAATQILGNQANAQLGASVASAGDVNGDGYADVIVGAPFQDSGQSDEGAAFVYFGSVMGVASGNPAAAAARIEANQASAELGTSVASAGDVNGDGYSDVIVGAWRYDAGQTDEGAAFVFHGGASGITSSQPGTAAALLQSNQIAAGFGRSVASAGDVNGDGYDDVIVGAFAYDAGEGHGEGAAFVFHGGAGGVASGDPASAHARLESDQAHGELGSSVAAAGDVNGDGFADVIVGAWQYDSGEIDEGAAFVFRGGPAGIGNASPATAAAELESDQASPKPQLGFSVAGAGDVNGDGFSDVIVGANLYDAGDGDEGVALIFLGGGNGSGRALLAQQLRGDASGVPVQPLGAAFASNGFVARARGWHPGGRGRVKLEVESCAAGVAFGHASCIRQVSAAWTDVGVGSAGVSLSLPLGGLPADAPRRWRARVLRAPFSVTQPGIVEPELPAHGPWRRLAARADAADIRVTFDSDPDDDDDGVIDAYETGTGVFFSITNVGTQRLDPDSDDDGVIDGAEVALGSNPNAPDHDGDGVCDGSGTGGGACTAGPDNCPLSANAGQQNSDALAAGDVCQCGDVSGDGVVTAADVARAREHLVGATLGGPFVAGRCNVVGPSDGGATDCDVADLAVLQRHVGGRPATVQNVCEAYTDP